MKIKVLFISLSLLFINESKAILYPTAYKEATKIDMKKYKTISFDSLIEDIYCMKLDKNIFNNCISMMRHKDNLYFMGNTIAGKNIVIYNSSGKFINEITFSDALLVNSMCIIPHLEELWVVSRFKIVNKYKLDGIPINKISLPFACAHIVPVDKQNYLIYSGGGCDKQGNIDGYFMALTDLKSINNLFIPKWGKRKRPYADYNRVYVN